MDLAYRVDLRPDKDGTLLVTSPDFPELTTFGEDKADALWHARDAIEEAIHARISDGQPVPRPSPCPDSDDPKRAHWVRPCEMTAAFAEASWEKKNGYDRLTSNIFETDGDEIIPEVRVVGVYILIVVVLLAAGIAAWGRLGP